LEVTRSETSFLGRVVFKCSLVIIKEERRDLPGWKGQIDK